MPRISYTEKKKKIAEAVRKGPDIPYCKKCNKENKLELATHPLANPYMCLRHKREYDNAFKRKQREKKWAEAKEKKETAQRIKELTPLAQPEMLEHVTEEGHKKLGKKRGPKNNGPVNGAGGKFTKKTYKDLPENVKFILDTSALGYSPSHIQKLMKDKYGDDSSLVASQTLIVHYRRTYIDMVMERERELRQQIPIVSPVARMQYLQDVATKGLMGETRWSKDGEPYQVYELPSVIAAIKEMNVMQRTLQEQKNITEQELAEAREIDRQKRMILQYIAEKKEETGKTEGEILNEITDELKKDYGKAIEAIKIDLQGGSILEAELSEEPPNEQ